MLGEVVWQSNYTVRVYMKSIPQLSELTKQAVAPCSQLNETFIYSYVIQTTMNKNVHPVYL